MIFDYLDAIFSIQIVEKLKMIYKRAILNESLDLVHLDLLKYCNLQNYNNAFIFTNQISLISDVEEVTNNEIISFIKSNIDWDILVIGINGLTNTTLLDGYTRIYKLNNDTTTFYSEYGYIASKQFMEKVANNNLEIINTYVLQPTFLNITSAQSISDRYIVTKASNLSITEEKNILYMWSEIIIK
jgi:hypothetical protein